MISPFTNLNTAAMRAERAARLRARATDWACLTFAAALAVVLADAILTTSLQFPDLLARAEAFKGM